jgi:DNA primase
MDLRHELSSNWKNHYDGKIPSPEEIYKEDVISTLRYLRLHKIKRLMEENQRDMQKPHTDDEYQMIQQTHKHLKEMERELASQPGSVIVKWS